MSKPKCQIFSLFSAKITEIKICHIITALILLTSSNISTAQQSYDFSSVDRLIEDAVRSQAFPSAVLIVGNLKQVIYENSYGRLTYDENSEITTLRTIYDLASVTKVIATTAAIMKLYKENKIDLNAPVAGYIPEFNNNGKSDITVMNLLVHNSGLTAWTPFYQDTNMSEPQKVKEAVYSCTKEYSTGTQTIYSDYNAFLLGELVERISGKKLDKFCKENIFRPLSMTETFFLAPVSEDYRIAPTEYDSYWRNQLLIGYVHDEMAALLEGVSGNAGLFSTAPDLYKFMKMMLNKGIYKEPGSTHYDTLFNSETVELFTSKVTGLGYNNTRALGWETKPEPTKYPPQCGYKFSNNCFGHTGYTGTSVWADKDKDLIIIFLTNRVYPKRGNEEIRVIRPKIHDEVCRIMGY
ncbi:MAG: beta-lactamase family protein [Chlorobi bacterium]|nr:beta-lactamase family protein [Chlorobiota bacterium]MCI0717155.1 beta-lactamase family protein [Chlorobiota bacterium]